MGEFVSLVAKLDFDEVRRGRQFERIVEWFLTHAPEYQTLVRRVWLWNDWPDRLSPDLGIDLVAESRSGELWAIQAKAYAPEYAVTKRDIDSFLAASASRHFSYRLLVATTDRIAANARKTIGQQAIPVGTLLRSDLAAASVNWPTDPNRLVAAKPLRRTLRADQRKAVREVLSGFEDTDRGQMIRACGTGKTLAALGVRERLHSARTLVLVPSLSLLSQILREWTANAKVPFEYLAVCSDDTVAEPDAPVATTHDLGVPVTTDAENIAAFLRRRGPRVVFSTYQSSPQIAAAYRKRRSPPPAFDLSICDEAHRCAGAVSSDFATILDGKKIRAKRRLFMTATPRYFTGRVVRAAREADFEIASMDDVATFGPVFHRLTFAQAIEQALLSDYQVVIVGVDDATYKAWAEDGRYVTRDGTTITDARTLAGQIGLAKAIRECDLHRVITFHNRVAAARRFSRELPAVVAWMPLSERPSGNLQADYVSGEMPTGERRRRLTRLAKPPGDERALLANARCLAEGIDVPTLDGVAFIDPRRSEIEIVQAVGRAIRKAPDKKIGTIVLPVFIDTDEDADAVLDQSVFEPVWGVLKALRSHDEQLASALDAIRRAWGRARVAGNLPSKIVFDLPDRVGVEFAEKFRARIVDTTTASWEYWFGRLEAFAAREGHARVAQDHIENGALLGKWVNGQRNDYKARTLAAERIARLEAIPGWSWGTRADQWEDNFALLEQFVAREGHARIPPDHVEEGARLGKWVASVRRSYNQGKLSAEQVRRLEAFPTWSWNTIRDRWTEVFATLEGFVAREGHARVPLDYIENGVRLSQWVKVQRRFRRTGRLTAERVAHLESLSGWIWDDLAGRWPKNFAALQQFAAREGHAVVPRNHTEDGIRLGQWVNLQRTKHNNGQLAARRVALLQAVPGWTWNSLVDRWDAMFVLLTRFVARKGHASVPSDHIEDGAPLGRWVIAARQARRNRELSADQVARLEALPGWIWNTKIDQREAKLVLLEQFVEREGHARVPSNHIEDGAQLGTYVGNQRSSYRDGKLSAELVARLEALPGWSWGTTGEWEDKFALLEQFVEREGHALVPSNHIEDGAQLGTYVSNQRSRYRNGKLSADRVARLEALPGWTWRSPRYT